MERVVAVTPAGRRGYLELLAHYVLADPDIDEWQLWDNCRQQSDREYLQVLKSMSPKVRIVTMPKVDGNNGSINAFYKTCDDVNAFYVKMDDDLVYLQPGLSKNLLKRASLTRGSHLWWSPLVINNATCTWSLKYFSKVFIAADASAQAGCRVGWNSAEFASSLHAFFLELLRQDKLQSLFVPDIDIMATRFSINCIGFFGSDVRDAGESFCPPGVDDEEWLSAVLPARLNMPGRIIGDLIVAHFGFFPQELKLLKTNTLDKYYELADMKLTHRPVRKMTAKGLLKMAILSRVSGPAIPMTISIDSKLSLK